MRIEELADPAAQREATHLLGSIWRAPVVDPALLRAVGYSGGYVAGAYEGTELVGAAVGFLGAGGHLHAHIAGVAAARRGASVGYALKQHQRSWALARGISRVYWTFDPLIRSNASFNLRKLGALPVRYLPEFYGPMTDGVNAGDASDRLYVAWDLTAPRVVLAAAGTPAEVSDDGAEVLLDEDGTLIPGDAPRLTVAVPVDVLALRATDPAAAHRWRAALRTALLGALDGGYVITGLTRRGHYLLEKS
ncbi:GNAT family N-acetyltransferase [Longispora urticae]